MEVNLMSAEFDKLDDFEEIHVPKGETALENSTVTHVFESDDGDRLTVVETLKGQFVAYHELVGGGREYYQIVPEISIEASTLPVIEAGYDISEFNAEQADMRIHDLMRDLPEDGDI